MLNEVRRFLQTAGLFEAIPFAAFPALLRSAPSCYVFYRDRSAGGKGMADIFISYSKKHAGLTEALARDLEAEGYTTWWDTSLLPDDGFFPQTIRAEIEAAKAVIVIWAEHSVTSKWVWSEAHEGDQNGKLLQLRDETLDPRKVPMPFTSGNVSPVTDRAKIFAALARRSISPSINRAASTSQEAAPPGYVRVREHFRPAQSAVNGRVKVTVGVGLNARKVWLKPGESFRDFNDAPEMVVVPAGSFMMGSKDGEGNDDERPQHKATIPQAFAVGKCPVTFAEWDAYVAEGGSGILGFGKRYSPSDHGWGRGRQPVINVSWDDAQVYIKWLSEKTGQNYRLLSEAEWEYACRAETETVHSFSDEEANLGLYAWYSANAGGKTHPVGEKAANDFGLHDMRGNVMEWCEDTWHDSYKDKPENLKSTGTAWTTGVRGLRVLRGGSSGSNPGYLRAAWRFRDWTNIHIYYAGLRVARTL
ncbi:MAG: SUMF1/EgtB/PvdO family nonheme iron enzyme [Rhodomicrobium sp.]